MKPNLLLYSIIVLSFFSIIANAQDGIIHLHGQIDTSITRKFGTKELSIRLNKTTNHYNNGIIITVPLNSDGTYDVEIKSTELYSYLSFWMMNNSSSAPELQNIFDKFPNLQEVYLFQSGDNIEFRVFKGGSFIFNGKGSEKLACQADMYNIQEPHNTHPRKEALQNIHDYKAMYELKDKLAEFAIGMKLAILNSYKSTLKKEIFNLLYLDVIGSIEYDIQDGLWLNIPFQNSTNTQQKLLTQQYYQSTLNKPKLNEIDSTYIAESAYFPELIFAQEFNTSRLYGKNPQWGDSFNAVYKKIIEKYKGKLRDKLLLICYQRLADHFSEEAKTLLDETLNIVQNESYKQLIKEWEEKKTLAFPFELQDVNSKIHRLNDYLGKIIVMDFWFTGCAGCIDLNTAMHAIIQRYKDNKDVVFITVSTDGRKDQWIKSLKTEKYSSPETIDLYTGGLGTEHPIFKYYNFIGAPQQIIIDKKGRLITSNPPRPDATSKLKKDTNIKFESEEATEAFIKLIDDNLKTGT